MTEQLIGKAKANRAVAEARKALDDIERDVAAGTPTYVLGPYLSARAQAKAASERAPAASRAMEARLEEAVGLAAAIDLTVVGCAIAQLQALRPATYLGKGKVEEVAAFVAERGVKLVVVDAALSPIQQRNLEKAWGCKVIDRTGLILEIFGRRARTKEGTLQVELAHLNYQKSRLVRSWTHLERQRGGFGFLGGPGETQIEADRRLIQDRVTRIERELETVVRTRGLHRKSRQKVPYPVVALVGYTNAGKSTLFNRLAGADVFAKDLLFATLDPTARAIKLPHGQNVILSDTVGFISDLPTMLVAAFRATLEDVVEADVILHVRDVAHDDTEAQSADVEAILTDLGVMGAKADPLTGQPAQLPTPLIEVWNKADLLEPHQHDRLAAIVAHREAAEQPVLISALTGEGLPALMALIEKRLAREAASYLVTLEPSDGAGLAWLHGNTEVLERRDDAEGRMLIVSRVTPIRRERMLQRFPAARAL
jgi:GTP-binding protein HflX